MAGSVVGVLIYINDTHTWGLPETFQEIVIPIHAIMGSIMVLIAPFQLAPAFRKAYPVVHRWMGRTYFFAQYVSLTAAAVGAPTLLFASQLYPTLFVLVVQLWVLSIGTGVAALLAIRRGDWFNHRKWMIRNVCIVVSVPFGYVLVWASSAPFLGNSPVVWEPTYFPTFFFATLISCMALSQVLLDLWWTTPYQPINVDFQ